MNKRPIRICGTEDQSLRVRLCWKQEELAKNLRQMGWPIIWKNARKLKARLPGSKPATRAVSVRDLSARMECRFRAGSASVDLAADFRYSLVSLVDS
jgi:hypothetical protein